MRLTTYCGNQMVSKSPDMRAGQLHYLDPDDRLLIYEFTYHLLEDIGYRLDEGFWPEK